MPTNVIGQLARSRGRRALAAVGLVAAATAAAHAQVALSPGEWADAVRDRDVDPAAIDNPLAWTEEMGALAREVAGEARHKIQLQRLLDWLFDREGTGFDYDSLRTLTAAEAFARRSGNCVSFTNMFIALGRSIGITVVPALVGRREGVEREGDLLLVKNHIVAIYRDQARRETVIYDFYETRSGPPLGLTPIDDLWATAIYVNNLGVLELREGRHAEAAARFADAVRLAPRYTPLHVNLGVARRRLGDLAGAIDAYLVALQLEPKNEATRDNLLALFRSLDGDADGAGDDAAPAATGAAAVLERRGDEALARGEVRRARRSYRKALAAGGHHAGRLLALARCELLLGRLEPARERLREALSVAPDHAQARALLESLEGAVPAGG